MVLNASPWIVGSNYADRQCRAGCGEAKRADQKVAARCNQFKL
jgi:hypothetical protein